MAKLWQPPAPVFLQRGLGGADAETRLRSFNREELSSRIHVGLDSRLMPSRWPLLICLPIALGSVSELTAATATVRCRPAKGVVAVTICGTPEYVAMDREIAALTDRATAKFSSDDQRRLAQTELHYFHQRQGCQWAAHNSAHPGTAVDECVRASMEGRVHALRMLVDRGGF